MDDLISRQAAIDEITEHEDSDIVVYISVGELKRRLEQLPSAQPDPHYDEWCTDCKEYDHDKHCCPRWGQVIRTALEEAQPQRTCVNCGRTVNNGGWYADGRTRCPIEEHYALPKDGYCHLWEKRNVTDDDYPERRTDGRD